jgi:division/cell wall cluster transcriptional repressor MraZ
MVNIGDKWWQLVTMARVAKIKTGAVNNSATPYLGQHLRGVDHGRVILPVEWRPDGSPQDFMVIIWPVTTREYLLVLPPSRWVTLQKNLECLSLTDEQAATVERLIGSSTFMRTMDTYGRLPLPEEAAKRLGIESEATLVGRMNKFEIWSPSRYAATLANPDAQLIADALKSIKI